MSSTLCTSVFWNWITYFLHSSCVLWPLLTPLRARVMLQCGVMLWSDAVRCYAVVWCSALLWNHVKEVGPVSYRVWCTQLNYFICLEWRHWWSWHARTVAGMRHSMLRNFRFIVHCVILFCFLSVFLCIYPSFYAPMSSITLTSYRYR